MNTRCASIWPAPGFLATADHPHKPDTWRSASLLASFFAASAGGMFQSDGEEVSDDALCVEDIVFDII